MCAIPTKTWYQSLDKCNQYCMNTANYILDVFVDDMLGASKIGVASI